MCTDMEWTDVYRCLHVSSSVSARVEGERETGDKERARRREREEELVCGETVPMIRVACWWRSEVEWGCRRDSRAQAALEGSDEERAERRRSNPRDEERARGGDANSGDLSFLTKLSVVTFDGSNVDGCRRVSEDNKPRGLRKSAWIHRAVDTSPFQERVGMRLEGLCESTERHRETWKFFSGVRVSLVSNCTT